MTYKVKVSNVYKLYSTESKRTERLMDFFSLRRDKKNEILFAALKDVSFTAYEGETIGILGLNGSGKSTLSNILGQVVQPTFGDIKINGVPSLIAISAGLNNNLSGKDNIYLKCMMHGLTEQEIEEVKDDIIDFAEIGDYINKPVKNYSSGMRSRLGFAISVHTNPDILIIDEALSVGDTTFANKCLEKMEEFKKQGKTIFFVSHSASQMKSFCDRIIWLHYGKVRAIGTVEDVIKQYNTYVHTVKKMTQERKLELKNKSLKEQYISSNDINTPKEKRRKLPFILSIITLFIPLFIFGILVVAGY